MRCTIPRRICREALIASLFMGAGCGPGLDPRDDVTSFRIPVAATAGSPVVLYWVDRTTVEDTVECVANGDSEWVCTIEALEAEAGTLHVMMGYSQSSTSSASPVLSVQYLNPESIEGGGDVELAWDGGSAATLDLSWLEPPIYAEYGRGVFIERTSGMAFETFIDTSQEFGPPAAVPDAESCLFWNVAGLDCAFPTHRVWDVFVYANNDTTPFVATTWDADASPTAVPPPTPP
jgi:hypothetical protein